MDKRFQVFVSSTYSDLTEERAEVMQALLELDCMPAGMELFPAANDDQWSWIKRIIDESDYYLVIVGGRYGSVSTVTGMSFTEMEYRYATDTGKPVIGFLRDDPAQIKSGKSEQDPKRREQLEEFRALVQKRLCKFYSSPADLGAKVSRSLTQLIRQYPAPGWVRAAADGVATSPEEVLRLHRRIEELELQLSRISKIPPQGSDRLAQGDDQVDLSFTFQKRAKKPNSKGKVLWQNVGTGEGSTSTTWDTIFGIIAPSLIGGVDEYRFSSLLDHVLEELSPPEMNERNEKTRTGRFHLTSETSNRILVQLRALGLITFQAGEYRGSWVLTPFGDTYMTRILAAKREDPPAKSKVQKRRPG